MTGYPVLWREGKGRIYAGKVEVGPRDLTLEGSCHGRGHALRRIPYEDLAGLSLTLASEERLYGKLTLVLELHGGGAVEVTSVNGVGTVRDLEEQIASFVLPSIPVD
jgi:hypothetical protein